jgi:uroporphyrinogen-III synthase
MAADERRLAKINMTVLITRPLAAAKRTEQAFQAAGISTWIDPVLTITLIPTTIKPAAYDAIITTSANGVESFAKLTQHRNIPIFCVGDASAAIARELGFTSVFHPIEHGGKELVILIKQSPFKRFAYIRGEVVKIDIANALANVLDMRIDTYITYKTVPTTAWTDETLDLFHTKKISTITFYSEYSAQVILNLLRAHNLLDCTHFITALCLSEAIADVIHDLIWKEVKIQSS